MVVAAGDNDATRIQRLLATVKTQGQLRTVRLVLGAAAKCAECETSLMILSVVAGGQLPPGWRS